MKKIIQFSTALFLNIFPVIAFATTNTLKDLVELLAYYMNMALALLMGLAVLIFVFYVVMYFIKPSGSVTHTEAGKYVMYSLLGFFIIFSMWGLVNILMNTFNLGQSSPGSWSNIKNLFPQQ